MARLKIFDTNAMVAVFHGHVVPDPEQVRVAVSVITKMELRAWPNLTRDERKGMRVFRKQTARLMRP